MPKGIYCLEGFWYGRHDKTSVRPILHLLDNCQGIKHFYHKCATESELEYMVKQWGQVGFQKKYPIIYFATHGREKEEKKFNLSESKLYFGPKETISLDKIAELLEGKCNRSIFYFGSCNTFDIDRRHIDKFLERTKGLAAIGYTKEVDWLPSAAMEILALGYLYSCDFNIMNAKEIESGLRGILGKYAIELGLRII